MKWHKMGLIYEPTGKDYWQKTHAALPTALQIKESLYRIYFTSRDSGNKTYVGFFEIDINYPSEIINKSEFPVLSPGKLGFFDDHGVQCTSIVDMGDEVYMYYLGWSPSLTRPLFYTSIGLAISHDGGETFHKYSSAPIMERSQYDPWMVSGGTVRKEDDLWKMWYISGIEFTISGRENNQVSSKYDIKYAESNDGINWNRKGEVCLSLEKEETNISRPTILKVNNLYHCWYPVKREGKGYRLGYATSVNGLEWERHDESAGMDVSADGWDSEAIDKMEVIKHKEVLYMFYNGNLFGYDGIGMAVSELAID